MHTQVNEKASSERQFVYVIDIDRRVCVCERAIETAIMDEKAGGEIEALERETDKETATKALKLEGKESLGQQDTPFSVRAT